MLPVWVSRDTINLRSSHLRPSHIPPATGGQCQRCAKPRTIRRESTVVLRLGATPSSSPLRQYGGDEDPESFPTGLAATPYSAYATEPRDQTFLSAGDAEPNRRRCLVDAPEAGDRVPPAETCGRSSGSRAKDTMLSLPAGRWAEIGPGLPRYTRTHPE